MNDFFHVEDIFGILLIVGSWLKLTHIALNDKKDLRKKEKKDE